MVKINIFTLASKSRGPRAPPPPSSYTTHAHAMHVPKSQLVLENFLIPNSYLSPKQLPECFEHRT